MQLVASTTSPFVRKVRVLLHETGKTDAVETIWVNTSPLATDPRILPVNPLGKIPALIRDDGPAIYDSRVITRFLDAHFRLGLYPERRLWDVLTLEATADAMTECAVAIVYESRFRSPDQQSPDWIEAQWAKVARALDTLEQRWISHLQGPLDMGQIAVGCTLAYLDFRHEGRNWRAGRPALAIWADAFTLRPSMVASRPE